MRRNFLKKGKFLNERMDKTITKSIKVELEGQ